MDTHVGKLIDSVGSIFRGSDVLPWCDPDIIAVSLSFPSSSRRDNCGLRCRLPPREACWWMPPIRPFPSSAFLSLWWDAHERPTNRHGVRWVVAALGIVSQVPCSHGEFTSSPCGRLNQQWITSHSTVALLRSLSKTNQLSDCIPLSGQTVFDHAHARLIVIVATRSLWSIPFYQGFESEVAEAANEEQKTESLMRLSWALVHSRQPEDVNRGIGMLEGDIYTLLVSNSINSWTFLSITKYGLRNIVGALLLPLSKYINIIWPDKFTQYLIVISTKKCDWVGPHVLISDWLGPHLLTSVLMNLELAIIVSMLRKVWWYKEMTTCHKACLVWLPTPTSLKKPS